MITQREIFKYIREISDEYIFIKHFYKNLICFYLIIDISLQPNLKIQHKA